MESETSDGYGSNKGNKLVESEDGGGGGLGLKLQRTESFPYKMMMNQNRQLDTTDDGGGPTFDIYDGIGLMGVGSGGGGGGCVSRTLQPFKVGGMAGAAASLRFPFTSAQWMELERQALIFKHMMASVPVPTDLLLPICRNISDTVASHSALGRGSCFNMRFSNNTDPEPGRCRRTDGKKWRCSRDVAPDQKYCERHMHRGRPRSRKHVEVQSEINNNNNITPSVPTSTQIANTTSTTSHHFVSSRPYNQPSGIFSKPDFKVGSFETMGSATPYKEPRGMEWTLKGSNVPMTASDHDLQQLMQGKQNSAKNSPVFPQHYQGSLNLNSYFNGEASDPQHQSNQSCLFLNSELASLDETPRRFIDAWSTANDNPAPMETNKSSISPNGNLSPSTLSLSVSGDNDGGVGEEMDQLQMGLNVLDRERENGRGINNKSPPLSWMTPVSWVASPPGGPLGEVLQSTTMGSNPSYLNSTRRSSSSGGRGLNLMTDGWVGSNETSPRATTISSPSGVLQKTLASLSDSSGNSSPTIAAPPSEIALPWMNQSKLPST